MIRPSLVLLLAIPAATWLSGKANHAIADTFGTGMNQFTIDFVPIGNPKNAADATGHPNPAGAVDYVFNMGKYEISREQVEKANAEAGLEVMLADMSSFSGGNLPAIPAGGVSWNMAARFANWLNTSKGFPVAYKFSTQPEDPDYDCNEDAPLWDPGDVGYNEANPIRNGLAHYFLPNTDEWYKAAYYDPSSGKYFEYPTGSDTDPIDVASGTAAGTAVYLQTVQQGPADTTYYWVRGGFWNNNVYSADNLSKSDRYIAEGWYGSNDMGFRVASIPEPGTAFMGALATVGLLLRRRIVACVNGFPGRRPGSLHSP